MNGEPARSGRDPDHASSPGNAPLRPCCWARRRRLGPATGSAPGARDRGQDSRIAGARLHRRRVTCRAHGGDERGSAAVELTLLTPLLVVFVLVVVAAGRLAGARLDVDDAAHQGARAATLARDPATAAAAARSTATAALAEHGVSCQHLQVTVDTTAFGPGGHATVTVVCTVALHDLALPAVRAHRVLAATFTAPVDTWRAVSAPGRAPAAAGLS